MVKPADSYFRVYRNPSLMKLMNKRQSAVCLMLAIAQRARVTDGGPHELKAGQALIGDWKQLGYPSYKIYRKDTVYLEKTGWVTIKATTKGMIRGSVATITESSPFQVKMLPKNSNDSEHESSQTPDAFDSKDRAYLEAQGGAYQNEKTGISPGISLLPDGSNNSDCNRGGYESNSEKDLDDRAYLRADRKTDQGHINGHNKGPGTNNGTNVTKGSVHQKITTEGKLKRASEKAKSLFHGRQDNRQAMNDWKAAKAEVDELEFELSKFSQ